eukprot:167516_1
MSVSHFVWYNPWMYPTNVDVSDALLQRLSDIKNNAYIYNKLHTVNACKLAQTLLFGNCITKFNRICHAVVGHYVPSLSFFNKTLYHVIQILFQNDKCLCWYRSEQLMKILVSDFKYPLQIYHDANIVNWTKSVLETITLGVEMEISNKGFEMYAKHIYLLEKMNYNNKTSAALHKQKEQISIVPWSVESVDDTQYASARKCIETKWKQIKNGGIVNKYIIEKLQFDSELRKHQMNTYKNNPRKSSNKHNDINCIDETNTSCISTVEYTIDNDNTLWNLSFMKDLSYDGIKITKM